MMLLFLLSVFVFIFINVLDASNATLFVSALIYLLGFIYSHNVKNVARSNSVKLFYIVYSVYLFSASIFALSFQNGNYFLLSDPVKYIEELSIVRDNSIEYYKSYFYDCYFNLADNNAVYNSYIRISALISNLFLGSGSVHYLTLTHTLFGILSSTVLFRILMIYFPLNKAYKYTLCFSLFSIFHFYSAVIVRDIIICFLYLLVFEIVLQKYSHTGLIKLIFLLFITWGIRLYSGLFIAVFVLYYVYLPVKKSKYSIVATPLFLFAILLIVLSSSFLISQTIDEINIYQSFSLERAGSTDGLSSYLIRLPTGVREVVLAIYSQFHPFPPFAPLLSATTFSQMHMSIITFIYSTWWALVFFPLAIFMLSKKVLIGLKSDWKLLYLIALIFILVNTAHIDVRRMMPVYPLLYLIFLVITNNIVTKSYRKNVYIFVIFVLLFALTFYLLLIG